jgi:hypothetical protein
MQFLLVGPDWDSPGYLSYTIASAARYENLSKRFVKSSISD